MALAYRLTYTFDYGTELNNGHTYVQIHRYSEDVQTPKDLNGLNQGVTFTLDSNDDEMFGPIKSQICTVNLFSESNFEFLKFVNAVKSEWRIKVFKGGTSSSNLIYTGYNVISDYSEAYVQAPYPVQLTFTDGIS